DSGPRAGLEHVAGALHVVAIDLGPIPGPEAIVGGDVEDEPAALDRRAQGVGLEDVSADEVGRAAFERPEAARRTGQHSDAAAVGHQPPRPVGSHEAGVARAQHIHGYATPPASLLPIGQGEDGALANGTGKGWARRLWDWQPARSYGRRRRAQRAPRAGGPLGFHDTCRSDEVGEALRARGSG